MKLLLGAVIPTHTAMERAVKHLKRHGELELLNDLSTTIFLWKRCSTGSAGSCTVACKHSTRLSQTGSLICSGGVAVNPNLEPKWLQVFVVVTAGPSPTTPMIIPTTYHCYYPHYYHPLLLPPLRPAHHSPLPPKPPPPSPIRITTISPITPLLPPLPPL